MPQNVASTWHQEYFVTSHQSKFNSLTDYWCAYDDTPTQNEVAILIANHLCWINNLCLYYSSQFQGGNSFILFLYINWLEKQKQKWNACKKRDNVILLFSLGHWTTAPSVEKLLHITSLKIHLLHNGST